MNPDKLNEALEHLRHEIEQLDVSDTAAKQRLGALITDIERKLGEPDDDELHETIVGNVRDAIGQFETEHPRATSILNQIMMTLGDVGI